MNRTAPAAASAPATAVTALVLQVLATAAVVLTALTVALAAAHGVRLVPILTGSMAPTAPAGSLAVTVPVAGTDVHPGDVVAFRAPRPYEVPDHRPILHRVAAVTAAPGDPTQLVMTTEGDANPGPDPWRVVLTGAQVGRAVVTVPHLGHLLAGGRWGTLSGVAGVLALLGAARLWRTPPPHHRTGVCCPQHAAATT